MRIDVHGIIGTRVHGIVGCHPGSYPPGNPLIIEPEKMVFDRLNSEERVKWVDTIHDALNTGPSMTGGSNSPLEPRLVRGAALGHQHNILNSTPITKHRGG